MTRPSVRIHSDSPFFSGSESLIAVLMADPALAAKFDLSLEYRAHGAYEAGMRERLPDGAATFPLDLPEVASWAARLPAAARPAARALAHASGLKYRYLDRDLAVLRQEFARSRPDIVHVQSGGYPGAYSGLAAAVAAKESGARVVFVANNQAIGYDTPTRWFDRAWDRRAVGAVDVWVTGSGSARARLREVLGLPEGAVRVVHNGIGVRPPRRQREQVLAELGVDPSRVVVAIVANLERRKGHLHLLRALEAMRGAGSPLPAVVIEGTGPESETIRAAVSRMGLGDDVVMAGRLDYVPDLLANADVVALPSVALEDFPNVVLEAMAYGKPVLASRIAGVPEQAVDGETGLLTGPGDEAGLARALTELVADAGLRRRMGDAGRERFEAHFTAERAAAAYLDLYRELLAGSAPCASR